MLKMITAGESHGKCLTSIVEGFPSGLKINLDEIQAQLKLRQGGYGRGGRQKIETDRLEITAGVIKGLTTGAPLALVIENRDFKIADMPELFRPRPGHADLAGALKYHQGIRAVLERASARETAIRVAAGTICRQLLGEFGIEFAAHVTQVGRAKAAYDQTLTVAQIQKKTAQSDMRCVNSEVEEQMRAEIDEARRRKDTLGGQFEVRVSGLPVGLGSYVHYERKLDGRLAQILMSMQSIKSVEIGLGTSLGAAFGSESHDEIFYSKKQGYFRKTNRAGGLEGGVTNGADLVVRAVMKPISTLGQPMASVNMNTKKAEKADYERSDICAVPAGSVIGESLVAFTVADAFLEKFGGDSMTEIRRNFDGYLKQIRG